MCSMEFRKTKPSIAEAKELDMVQYLSTLGHEPTKIRNDDYWYLSPLREEHTPSFKINRRINKWYDHGLGRGGNLIDFATQYFQCSVADFLDKLSTGFSFQQQPKFTVRTKLEPEAKILIIKDTELSSEALLSYIKKRQIDCKIARQYCREVLFSLDSKTYFGIGFKNSSGGWEIRNKYFKTSSSPKDYTIIQNGSDQVLVFEGFFDFLTFKTICKNHYQTDPDFLILNSLSFFKKSLTKIQEYKFKFLYLDRDTGGTKATQEALSTDDTFIDKSHIYKGYKDLNEWHTQTAKITLPLKNHRKKP